MRADAYKQFNEAAIIQTVLSALPDIVRAAAEPMGHIDSLTVMSADGASEIVRNATRAMLESTTAIKGLTGLDVPSLIGGAMGRGFGERLRTGDGAQDLEKDARDARERLAELTPMAEAKARSDADAVQAKAKQVADDAKNAAKPVVEAAQASARAAGAAAQTAAAKTTAAATAAAAKLQPQGGTTAQWVSWLAGQLRQVDQIQAYGQLKLNGLVDRGPAPARVIWSTAQAVLGKDYGDMTI